MGLACQLARGFRAQGRVMFGLLPCVKVKVIRDRIFPSFLILLQYGGDRKTAVYQYTFMGVN